MIRSPGRRARRAQRENGFTFVELLIAATIMSVLFVGLGSHLRGGILVWRRATATAETVQRERVGFDRMERDLANAFAYGATRSTCAPIPDRAPGPPHAAKRKTESLNRKIRRSEGEDDAPPLPLLIF